MLRGLPFLTLIGTLSHNVARCATSLDSSFANSNHVITMQQESRFPQTFPSSIFLHHTYYVVI